MQLDRPRGPPVSVLVVDSYPDSAATLALVLTFSGFRARTALTAPDALTAATSDPPDVVIVEPRRLAGGWDLVRRLAGPFAGRRPILVAHTTDTTQAGREAATQAGVNLYVIKPTDPWELLAYLGQTPEPSLPRAACLPAGPPPTEASRVLSAVG
jgi:two-component system, OmpR family, response regulator